MNKLFFKSPDLNTFREGGGKQNKKYKWEQKAEKVVFGLWKAQACRSYILKLSRRSERAMAMLKNKQTKISGCSGLQGQRFDGTSTSENIKQQ